MTRKADSQRKKRQRAQPSAIESRIVERVESVASAHGVVAVESEFAGSFNELGVRINAAPEASAESIRILGNALLDAATQAASELDAPFTWSIGVYRNDELVRVVSPGDAPSRICPDCRYEQKTAGAVCIVCGESLHHV